MPLVKQHQLTKSSLRIERNSAGENFLGKIQEAVEEQFVFMTKQVFINYRGGDSKSSFYFFYCKNLWF